MADTVTTDQQKKQQQRKVIKVVAIGAGAFLLYKLLVPKTDTSGAAYDPTGNGGTPSGGTPFNASAVAEKLYDAMKNSGTDELAIVKALTPVNESQFAQVFQKFGKRSYNKLLGNQINLTPWSPLPLQNLAFWLQSELSTTRYNILRMKYPNFL